MGFLGGVKSYTIRQQRYLCAKLIPLTSLMTAHYGSIYCPFHPNFNTPAASLFKDPDGVERIYCYSCHKQYTSFDYIVEVLGRQPLDMLLAKYSPKDLDMYLRDIPKVEGKVSVSVEFNNLEELFTLLYNYENALGVKD